MTPEKKCRKCGNVFPATLEFFYKNSGGKFGLTPRCKTCVNEDNTESHKKRVEKNPEHIRKLATEKSKRHYHSNLENSRKRSREHAAKTRLDPEKKEKIQARKRAGGAGWSPEQIEALRIKQNNECAICSKPNPTDLDHNHKTGEIRFLLCKHCNRGLGAFYDDPILLRKAADMLEKLQKDEPVPSIMEKGS